MKYSLGEGYVEGLRAGSVAAPRVADAPVAEREGPVDTIRRIRGGLPVAEFHALADWLGMSEEDLAPLLGISRATLHRRKKVGRLDPPESERLVRFARLLALSTEVLGSEAAAREWLKQPAFAFPGESPLSFADTEIGAREVEALLGRLEHGVFS
jgi:putative toxin-antitoxin system antitoxin component (TIGR02293 family)